MRKKITVLAFVLVFLLTACATINIKMTDRDIASWMNSIYNAQYKDYLSWFNKDAQGNYVLKPNVPEAQKEVLRNKKEIFTKLHPLLITYSEYVKTGVVPTGVVIDDVAAQATKYINDLIADGGK